MMRKAFKGNKFHSSLVSVQIIDVVSEEGTEILQLTFTNNNYYLTLILSWY